MNQTVICSLVSAFGVRIFTFFHPGVFTIIHKAYQGRDALHLRDRASAKESTEENRGL